MEDRGQTAQDQPDKSGAGGQREVGEAVRKQAGEGENADQHTDQIRQQRKDAALEFAEKMGDAINQGVVDAHGNHHGAAADPRNDVRDADHDTAKQLVEQFHGSVPPAAYTADLRRKILHTIAWGRNEVKRRRGLLCINCIFYTCAVDASTNIVYNDPIDGGTLCSAVRACKGASGVRCIRICRWRRPRRNVSRWPTTF